jgi:hypothetical protein
MSWKYAQTDDGEESRSLNFPVYPNALNPNPTQKPHVLLSASAASMLSWFLARKSTNRDPKTSILGNAHGIRKNAGWDVLSEI